MPLCQRRDQQAGFLCKLFSAREVPFLQRTRRLIQEGLGLGEGPTLGIRKPRASKLLDAQAHVALCLLKLLPATLPRAVGGFERRRFDRRLLGHRFCRPGLSRRSTWFALLCCLGRRRGKRERRWRLIWFRRCRLFDHQRAGFLGRNGRVAGGLSGNIHQARATLPCGTPAHQQGKTTCRSPHAPVHTLLDSNTVSPGFPHDGWCMWHIHRAFVMHVTLEDRTDGKKRPSMRHPYKSRYHIVPHSRNVFPGFPNWTAAWLWEWSRALSAGARALMKRMPKFWISS